MMTQQTSNDQQALKGEKPKAEELTPQQEEFQKKYACDFMACLVSDVSRMGFIEVSDELKNIIGETNNDSNGQAIQIPSFEDNKISANDNNPYSEYFQKKLAEEYKKKVITDEVFSKIKDTLHYPTLRKETRSTINFNKLIEELPDFKYLFSPKILNRSEMTSKYDFMSFHYCEFVRKCQNIQNALLCMIEVIPNFSTQFIMQKDFEKFVDTYKTRIRALEAQRSCGMYEQFRPYYSLIVSTYFSFFTTSCFRDIFETKKVIFSDLFQQFIDMDNMERQNNPFISTKTMSIYTSFRKIDKDKTGRLTMEQFKGLEGYSLTDAFLERLFEVLQLVDNEVDFAEYIRFYIALNNIKTPQGTNYFFQIFDLNNDGQIDQSDINFFYKEIVNEFSKINPDSKYTGNFDHFLSQLFDIISCKSGFVTEKILIESNNQDVFFKILFDVNTFTKWETDASSDDEEEGVNESFPMNFT